MEFKEGSMPEKKLVTLTAYINEVDLLTRGKQYATHVVTELIRKTIMLKSSEIMRIADDILLSNETRDYVREAIRREIDAQIKNEINDMFKPPEAI